MVVKQIIIEVIDQGNGQAMLSVKRQGIDNPIEMLGLLTIVKNKVLNEPFGQQEEFNQNQPQEEKESKPIVPMFGTQKTEA